MGLGFTVIYVKKTKQTLFSVSVITFCGKLLQIMGLSVFVDDFLHLKCSISSYNETCWSQDEKKIPQLKFILFPESLMWLMLLFTPQPSAL